MSLRMRPNRVIEQDGSWRRAALLSAYMSRTRDGTRSTWARVEHATRDHQTHTTHTCLYLFRVVWFLPLLSALRTSQGLHALHLLGTARKQPHLLTARR